jgi:ornithine decarboxylase
MLQNGLGFDCASQKEIQTVLDIGTKPEDIIYAHPVKRIDDIYYADSNNIKLTTFDSIGELHKIKNISDNFKCVLRIKIDNPSAKYNLGLK